MATIVPNWNKGLISESELDSARLAYKSAQAQYIGAGHQYHNSTVTSPIAGVVTARPVNVGIMVNSGTVVANIIDDSMFKVMLNIAEKDVLKCRRVMRLQSRLMSIREGS